MKAAHSPGLTGLELVKAIEDRGYKVKWTESATANWYAPPGYASAGTTSWMHRTVFIAPWAANVRMALAHELEHVKGIALVEQTMEEASLNSKCGTYSVPPLVRSVMEDAMLMVARGEDPRKVRRVLERKYKVRIVD